MRECLIQASLFSFSHTESVRRVQGYVLFRGYDRRGSLSTLKYLLIISAEGAFLSLSSAESVEKTAPEK
jgi:hypothetical protein